VSYTNGRFPLDSRQLVAYCGLYCDFCSTRSRIPRQAATLQSSLRDAGYEDFATDSPDFIEFWRFLDGLTKVPDETRCRGGTCGHPRCAIRKCAKSRNVQFCPLCADYPCAHIQALSRSEPTLIYDGRRLREMGTDRLDEWIAQMERRCKAGLCYGDLRWGSCTVPLEE
jgi:hypothetical protein